MARRRLINNKVKNGDFTDAPTLVAPTTLGNRWIDGTASGSTTNSTYGWYLIIGVNNFQASLDSGILKMEATNTTGRGRVMTCPFESSTTPQNIQTYGIKINPSTSYTLTARIKGINVVDSSSLRISVQEYASSGSLITTASSSNLPAGDSNYTTYTVTFTTPATVSYANIYISVNTAGTVQSMWVDDVTLDTTTPTTRTLTTSRTLATNRVLTRDMGTALSFSAAAATNQVQVPHNSVFTFGRECTASIWFKPASLQFDAAIISKGIGTATPIDIRYTGSTGNVGTYVYDGTFQPQANTPTAKRLRVGLPYLITSVTSSASVTLYINGIFAATVTNTTVGTTDNALALTFGNRTSSAKYIDGILDEPRIWNRALTATEVANMYFNNAIPRNGLVGEWLFNETTGTTALDSSGNGNSGTISGCTYTTDTPLKVRNLV